MNSEPLEDRRERLIHWADGPVGAVTPPLSWLRALIRVIVITLREGKTNNLSLRSSALTYTILLSMVPMLAMSTAVVKGLGGGDQLREVVYTYLDTLEDTSTGTTAPADQGETDGQNAAAGGDTTLTGHLRSAVDQLFDYVDRTNFATLGTFGMLGIFLSVILVLNHIEAAMNTIWHVEAGRSMLRKITDYLTLMVLLPIALNVALAAGAVLESQALAVHLEELITASWVKNLLLKGVPIFFLTLALYALYLFFLNTKPKTLPTLVGALLAGTLWFITQNLYISLQVGVAKYNAIYGSFATLPLFLVWIYLGWLFVLLGAQLAYAIQNREQIRLQAQEQTPSVLLGAVFDLFQSVTSDFESQRPRSFDAIIPELPDYRPELLDSARTILITRGFLHHVDGSDTLMPSRPPGSVTPQQLIKAVFGSSPPESSGGEISRTTLAAALQAFPEKPAGRAADTGIPDKDAEAHPSDDRN